MNISGCLLLINLCSTWLMTGLIWFVQLVHYPLFARVSEEGFCEYHRRHTAWTTWVVGPGMLAEAFSAVGLLWWRPAYVPGWAAWVGLVLVGIVWGTTAFLSVPCHDRLGRGRDDGVIRRLVVTNWVRTLGWSLRAAGTAWMVGRGMG